MTPFLWDRLPCDTDESWRAFCAFRDMHLPRRLSSTMVSAAYMGTTAPTADLYRWYTDHKWPERTAAYDAHLDRIQRDEKEAVLKQSAHDVAVQHRALVNDAKELASLQLRKLLMHARESSGNGLMKPREVIQLVDASIKLDRLIRDQSTENVHASAGPLLDRTKLSAEELRTYISYLKKMAVEDVVKDDTDREGE